jgi:hypothetical protein
MLLFVVMTPGEVVKVSATLSTGFKLGKSPHHGMCKQQWCAKGHDQVAYSSDGKPAHKDNSQAEFG